MNGYSIKRLEWEYDNKARKAVATTPWGKIIVAQDKDDLWAVDFEMIHYDGPFETRSLAQDAAEEFHMNAITQCIEERKGAAQ